MIRVNADYETELFTGGPGPKGINEAIEFLAFFVSTEPVLTNKNYSHEYLDYVTEVTGNRPVTASSGSAVNWWGSLKDREKERWLNSKITSTEFALKNKWMDETFIIRDFADSPMLKKGLHYIVKSPYEMSGRGFTIITEWDKNLFKKEPLIIEPLRNRKLDFSLYYLDGKEIYYENLVDQRFQYKGSLFHKEGITLQDLSFHEKIETTEWKKYLLAKEMILSHFKSDIPPGFSIDSFVYEEDKTLRIHILSEVNARRTMGLTAYEIGKKIGTHKPWWSLVLGKSFKKIGGFTYLRSKLDSFIQDGSLVILSPGDARFEMIFLMADSAEEGEKILREINSLLPEADFPILR